jgi:hypothetical protein
VPLLRADSASPSAPRSSVTASGTVSSDSQPLTLSGDYGVRWTASDPSGGGCLHYANLDVVGKMRSAADLISTEVRGSGSGRVRHVDLARCAAIR